MHLATAHISAKCSLFQTLWVALVETDETFVDSVRQEYSNVTSSRRYDWFGFTVVFLFFFSDMIWCFFASTFFLRPLIISEQIQNQFSKTTQTFRAKCAQREWLPTRVALITDELAFRFKQSPEPNSLGPTKNSLFYSPHFCWWKCAFYLYKL